MKYRVTITVEAEPGTLKVGYPVAVNSIDVNGEVESIVELISDRDALEAIEAYLSRYAASSLDEIAGKPYEYAAVDVRQIIERWRASQSR